MKNRSPHSGILAAILVGGLALAGATVAACKGINPSASATPARSAAGAATSATAPYTWRNVVIGGGGFVTGIIPHPAKKGLMYARTDIGGAYRWDDAAKHWVSISDWVKGPDWNFMGIESLAVDPSDPNRLYIAAGTYTNDWAGKGAMFRSNDQGKTWQRTDWPYKFGGNEDGRSAGERLMVDPNLGSILYFGSRHEGLFRSSDSGATWKPVASYPVKTRTNGVGSVFVVFDAASGKKGTATPILYVAQSSKETGLYRSTDGGATWKPVPGQPTGLLPNHGVLDKDGSLYISYGDAPGPNGMTGGAVWKLNTKTGAWADISPVKPSNDDRFGYGGVTVDAQHPGTVMACTMDRWARGDDLFRSTDGGKTWNALGAKATRDASISPYLTWHQPTPKLGWWLGDIEIDPFDSNHVLYVTGATIWASTDATNADKGAGETHWVVGANGIEECVVQEIVSPPTGASLLSTVGDIDGFRHEDLNHSPREGFYNPGYGTNNGLDFAEKAPDVVVRTYGGGRTHGSYSLDNGKTWTAFATSAAQKGGGTIAVSADGSSFVWTPDNSAPFVSKDKGNTWTACTGLSPRTRVTSDRVNKSKFYAFQNGTVYVSADGGATFAQVAADLPKGDGYLRTAPGKEGELWLTTGDGLFHSKDCGAAFQKVAGVDNAHRIGFGKPAPGSDYPAIFLVGTVGGVYGIFRSDDMGAHWVRINDDQHQYGDLNSITGDPRVYGRVYLASTNRGVVYGETGARP